MQLQPLATHRHHVVLGQPLPFGIRDGDGRLLLARGQLIGSFDQLESLLQRGTFVDGNEVDNSAQKIAQARPEELPGLWASGMDGMHRALRSRVDGDFHRALEHAAKPVLALVTRDPDMAILQVVRHDETDTAHYASRHAVHAAIAGQLAARRLGWGDSTSHSLFRAALTMNLSMAELQDKLATQKSPLTPLQRQELMQHPERSAELLQTAGVTDVDWLAAVRSHHEKPCGGGYPKGLTDVAELAMLLHRADQYTAKFAARATRAPMAPDQAARELFLADRGNPMTAAIIKEFGIYPPGCAVRLKSGEIAIVMRRGDSANAPVVAAIVNRAGEPLVTPLRRDTALGEHAVVGVVPDRQLRVRPRMEDLVLACHH